MLLCGKHGWHVAVYAWKRCIFWKAFKKNNSLTYKRSWIVIKAYIGDWRCVNWKFRETHRWLGKLSNCTEYIDWLMPGAKILYQDLVPCNLLFSNLAIDGDFTQWKWLRRTRRNLWRRALKRNLKTFPNTRDADLKLNVETKSGKDMQ